MPDWCEGEVHEATLAAPEVMLHSLTCSEQTEESTPSICSDVPEAYVRRNTSHMVIFHLFG